MQFNQPFGKFAFESPFNFYQIVPPSNEVVGEGEVNSVLIPDGSMQMYFVPTIRYRWPPYPNSLNIDNFNKKSTEYWFVRRVTLPLPISTSISNQFPNSYGDRFSTRLCNTDCKPDLPFCPDYYQKFHNDNTTSTTDILYFYPSLRQGSTFQNNALVQTNTPTTKCNISYNGVNKPCDCNREVSFRIGKEMYGSCICQETASAMSVDSIKNKTSDESISKEKHRRYKSQRHKRKRRDHTCECNIGGKATSDKFVTTYNDRACGNDRTEGRDTQTKSRRSDIKTEIWVPIKRKSKTKSRISSLKECTSCSNTKTCACFSTTNTDDSQ